MSTIDKENQVNEILSLYNSVNLSQFITLPFSQINQGSTKEADRKLCYDLINKLNINDISSLIKICSDQRGDLLSFTNALLSASPVSTSDGLSRRIHITIKVIETLNEMKFVSKATQQIVNLILITLESLPPQSIPKIIDALYDCLVLAISAKSEASESMNEERMEEEEEGSYMQEACVFPIQLFPKCLSIVSKIFRIEGGEKNNESGPMYVERITKKVLGLEWHVNSSICSALLLAFKESPLNDTCIDLVINKVKSFISTVATKAVPDIMYNLLLFSSQGQKAQDLILTLIISHFNSVVDDATNKSNLENVYPLIGTVILTLTYAMKQDQSMGRQFLKRCHEGHFPASLFTCALLHSICLNPIFEQSALDILVKQVHFVYQEEEKLTHSPWLTQMTSFKGFRDFEKIVFLLVDNSLLENWDVICPSLVNMACECLVFSPPASCQINVKSSVGNIQSFGCRILLKLLRITGEDAKKEILKQITSAIVSSSSSSQLYLPQHNAKAIDILYEIAVEYPLLFSDQQSSVSQLIDMLPHFHSLSVSSIIRSLSPLWNNNLRLHARLLDNIIMILRKCCFYKDVKVRLAAVQGFLAVLSSFINPSSFASPMNDCVNALLKVLSWQREVKDVLYHGISKAVGSLPSELKALVLEMLSNNANKYFNKNKNVLTYGPFLLRECYSKKELIENYPLLLQAMLSCLTEEEKLHGINLDEIINNSITSNYKHYNIYKEATWDLEKDETKEDLEYARMILQTFQVFISHVALSRDPDFTIIEGLYAKHQKITGSIENLIKAHKDNLKVKNKPKLNSENECMTVPSLLSLLEAMNQKDDEENDDDSNKAKEKLKNLENDVFRKFLLSGIVIKLNEIQNAPHGKKDVEAAMGTLKQIAPTLFGMFHVVSGNGGDMINKENIVILSLKAYSSLLQCAFSLQDDHKSRLHNLSIVVRSSVSGNEKFKALIPIEEEEEDEDFNQRLISNFASKLLLLLASVIHEDSDKDAKEKIAHSFGDKILHIHSQLISLLDLKRKTKDISTLMSLLGKKKIGSNLASLLVKTILPLCSCEEDLSNMKKIGSNLSYLAKIDNEDEEEDEEEEEESQLMSENLRSLDVKVLPGSSAIYIHEVARLLEEIERINEQLNLNLFSLHNIEKETEKLFIPICERIQVVIQALLPLIKHPPLRSSPTIDHMLLAIQRIYRLLCSLVIFTSKLGFTPSNKIIKSLQKALKYVNAHFRKPLDTLFIKVEKGPKAKPKEEQELFKSESESEDGKGKGKKKKKSDKVVDPEKKAEKEKREKNLNISRVNKHGKAITYIINVSESLDNALLKIHNIKGFKDFNFHKFILRSSGRDVKIGNNIFLGDNKSEEKKKKKKSVTQDISSSAKKRKMEDDDEGGSAKKSKRGEEEANSSSSSKKKKKKEEEEEEDEEEEDEDEDEEEDEEDEDNEETENEKETE